ncbi:MFS transporter [Paenibacillus flagellatus]|nr:MFS transporter [Paenibacillus flagellatus]
MKGTKLAANIPLFYLYKAFSSFILDRAIWMLFLLSEGFSLSQIALLESAYHCTSFLLEVPTGYVADRYGKRASMLVAELIGVVSSGLLLWSGHGSIVVAGFLLGAVVGTFRSGATSAWIYETYRQLGKEGDFKRANSRLSAVSLVALGLSGVAGGALSAVDWAWVYAGNTALCLLTVVTLLLATEPRPEADEADGANNANAGGGGVSAYSFRKQLAVGFAFGRSDRHFAALCVYGAVLYAMSWSIAFYSQVVFRDTGLNNGWIGTINGIETWVSAAAAAVAFVGERRLGKRGSIVVSGIGFAAGLAMFVLARDAGAAIAAYLLMAVFVSYLEPLLEAYMNERLPSPIRATMLSFFSMAISIGMMATFSAIGFLADRIGVSAALQIALVVWLPLCLAAMRLAVKR